MLNSSKDETSQSKEEKISNNKSQQQFLTINAMESLLVNQENQINHDQNKHIDSCRNASSYKKPTDVRLNYLQVDKNNQNAGKFSQLNFRHTSQGLTGLSYLNPNGQGSHHRCSTSGSGNYMPLATYGCPDPNETFVNLNQSTQNLCLSGALPATDILLIDDLKREMHKREQEYLKQNAILQQQVELLEIQAEEFESREQNLKKIHRSMIKALEAGRNSPSEQCVMSTLQDQHSDESSYESTFLQEEEQKQQVSQRRSRKDLLEIIRKKDLELKNSALEMEESGIIAERKLQEVMLEKKNMEIKVRRLEGLLGHMGTAHDVLSKSRDREAYIERLKEAAAKIAVAHRSEMEQSSTLCTQLTESRAALQQEVEILSEKIQKQEMQETAKQLKIQSLQDEVDHYKEQFESLSNQVELMEEALAQDEVTLQQLRNQLQISQLPQLQSEVNLNEQAKRELQQPNSEIPDASEQSSMQIQRLLDENEYLLVQIQRQESTLVSNQERLIKFQQIQNLNHEELTRKDSQLAALKEDYNAEMAKYCFEIDSHQKKNKELVTQNMMLQDQILNLKNQFEEQKDSQKNQIREKDLQIVRQQTELNELQYHLNQQNVMLQSQGAENIGLMNAHSPIRYQNMSTLMASRDFQQLEQIQQTLQGLQSKLNSQNQVMKKSSTHQGQASGAVEVNQVTLAPKEVVFQYPNTQSQDHERNHSRNSRESQNHTLNLNTSQYPSQSGVGANIALTGLGISEPNQAVIYDLPRQIKFQPIAASTHDNQNCVNFSSSNIKIDFNEPENCPEAEQKVQISLSELDLLQSCQKIIDAASSMKCIQCNKVFQTTDFYDHIIVQRECAIETEMSERESNYDLGSLEEHEEETEQEMQDMQGQQPQNNREISIQKLHEEIQQLDKAHDYRNGSGIQEDMDILNVDNPQLLNSTAINFGQENSDLYQAFNLPLQLKDIPSLHTYQSIKSPHQGINFSHNCYEHEKLQTISPCGIGTQNQIGGLIKAQSSQNKASILRHKTKQSLKRQGGFGSRSGHTGMTGTVTSHILMSLSKSATSSSKSQRAEPNSQSRTEVEEAYQPLDSEDYQDDIRDLARQKYSHMLTEEKSQSKIQGIYLLGETNNNIMVSCPSDEESSEFDKRAQLEDGLGNSTCRSCKDLEFEKDYQPVDPSYPQNILSKSLRELVQNEQVEEQMAQILDLHENLNTAGKVSEGCLVQNLEKLYDLDTSRFEEAYSNLPSSKKKLLLNQIDEKDKSSPEQSKPNLVSASMISEKALANNNSSQKLQQRNFVDISKFNLSLDEGHHKLDEAKKTKPLIKVVGLDLGKLLKKPHQDPNQDKPRQLPLKKSGSMSKFEKSQIDVASQEGRNRTANLPKFDLSKQINEINKTKMSQDPVQRPNTQAAKSAAKSKHIREYSAEPKIAQNGHASFRKKQGLIIEIDNNNLNEFENDEVVASDIEVVKERRNLKCGSLDKLVSENVDSAEGLDKKYTVDGSGLDDLIKHKNVMESFRNYQNKLLHQNHIALNNLYISPDIGQFQSVSSKNGTQNIDFGNLGSNKDTAGHIGSGMGQQSSRRLNAPGTNRYNKNGFMLVTSQSSQRSSLSPLPHVGGCEVRASPYSQKVQKKVQPSNSFSNLKSLKPNGTAAGDRAFVKAEQFQYFHYEKATASSPLRPVNQVFKEVPRDTRMDGSQQLAVEHQNSDSKATEQLKLKQMSQQYSKRRQELHQHQKAQEGSFSRPNIGAQNSGQASDRHKAMDTSVDINLGSELGISPLSTRMVMAHQQICKGMKNIMANHNCSQINEEERSMDTYTQNQRMPTNQHVCSEGDQDGEAKSEQEDRCKELFQAIDSGALKPQEECLEMFRRQPQYTQNATKLTPSLKVLNSKSSAAGSFRPSKQRDTLFKDLSRGEMHGTSGSDKQFEQLRNQILLSQATASNQHAPYYILSALSGTQKLSEMKNTESILNPTRMLHSQPIQQAQNLKSPQNSAKNSDYIKSSILLMSSGRRKLGGTINGMGGDILVLPIFSNDQYNQADECPSYIDEIEFDEDHPVFVKGRLGHHPNENITSPNIASPNSFTEKALRQLEQSNCCGMPTQAILNIKNRPVTQRNMDLVRLRKDPLKNSLFHNAHPQPLTQKNINYQSTSTNSQAGNPLSQQQVLTQNLNQIAQISSFRDTQQSFRNPPMAPVTSKTLDNKQNQTMQKLIIAKQIATHQSNQSPLAQTSHHELQIKSQGKLPVQFSKLITKQIGNKSKNQNIDSLNLKPTLQIRRRPTVIKQEHPASHTGFAMSSQPTSQKISDHPLVSLNQDASVQSQQLKRNPSQYLGASSPDLGVQSNGMPSAELRQQASNSVQKFGSRKLSSAAVQSKQMVQDQNNKTKTITQKIQFLTSSSHNKQNQQTSLNDKLRGVLLQHSQSTQHINKNQVKSRNDSDSKAIPHQQSSEQQQAINQIGTKNFFQSSENVHRHPFVQKQRSVEPKDIVSVQEKRIIRNIQNNY